MMTELACKSVLNRPSTPTKLAQRASKSEPVKTKLALQARHQDQTGPKGQQVKTKLTRRTSKSGLNWPKGPLIQDQYIRAKLDRRASRSGPNWPDGRGAPLSYTDQKIEIK